MVIYWIYNWNWNLPGNSHNEPTLHPGFHFRLALLVPLGMRFLAEKLMFSRTVSLDATRPGPGKMGQSPFEGPIHRNFLDIRDDLGKGMKGTMAKLVIILDSPNHSQDIVRYTVI